MSSAIGSTVPAAILVFPALMAYAGVSDLLTMRIPNWVVLALVLAFFGLAALLQVPWTVLGLHLAIATATLVVGFGIFAMGWAGGGDAKLAAATALWFGPNPVFVKYLVIAALAGGAVGVLLLLLRRFPVPGFMLSWRWVMRLHDEKTGVPYGVALAAAALAVCAESPLWTALHAAA